MDFEGDQWTFLKPLPEDLELLFGVDIHEMQPYRPLPQQASEQISQGRTLIVELDSWYLPDTAATTTAANTSRARWSWTPSTRSRADALLPRRRPLRALRARTTAGCSASAASSPATSCRPTPSSRVSTPAQRSAVRSCAMPRESCSAATSPAAPGRTRSSVSAISSSATCRGCWKETPRTTTPYAFATVRMAGSAFEVAATHAPWLLGRPRRPGRRAAAADRRGLQGPLVQARTAARVRPAGNALGTRLRLG